MTAKQLLISVLVAVTGLLSVPLANAQIGGVRRDDSWARKIMHYDEANLDLEGITVAEKNPVEDTLEESTFNQHEILVTRRKFQMDSKGRIRNGLIFDGNNNLLGRTEYGFDKWDRIQQERLYTKKGKLVRAMIYRYDTNGEPIKPIAYTFDPSDPSSKKQITTDVEPILPSSRHETDYPGIRIDTIDKSKRAPTNNPLQGINGGVSVGSTKSDKPKNTAPPKPKKKKKGFLRRLFGGDD